MKKKWIYATCSKKMWLQKMLFMVSRISFFMLLGTLSLSAHVYSQDGFLDFKAKNVTLVEALKKITKISGYDFLYNYDVVASKENVSVDVSNVRLNVLLDKILAPRMLTYEFKEKLIVVRTLAQVQQDTVKRQPVKIKGTVTDEKGATLPGVTVLIKGTRLGVSTDVDGLFDLEVLKMDSIVLEFSFVGMKKKIVVIKSFPQNMKPLKVVMEVSGEELNEVVVTGIFNRKKEGFTGSAVMVKGEDLKKISTTSIAKALAAVDPSFRIMDDIMNGSNPNRLPDMRMRGQATLPGGGAGTSSFDAVVLQGEYATYPNQPLLIMDGFEISVQTMVDLDPDRVESITMLKDAAATAIYGSKAANGVIVIETKLPKEGKLLVSYGGNFRVQTPDLSGYNLMNASEKLEAERRAGFYDNEDGLEALEQYQINLRNMKSGVDTYWLSKPLQTSVQHRHALSFEGGDRSLRYKIYAGINMTPGVMIDSRRNTQTGSVDLSYRLNKVLLRNSVTVENTVGDESSYGSFSEYTRLNPYLRPYGPDGEILKNLQDFRLSNGGGVQRMMNPMYNATFNSKNRTTSFTVRNLFKLEYNPLESLRLQADFSLSKGNGKTEIFRPAQHTAFDGITDPELRGDFRRRQMENFSYSLDITAGYNEVFHSMHYMTLNARMSIQESQDEQYGALVTGFPNDNMDNILFGKKYNEKMSGSENTSRTIGWVASLGYSYDYKYSVDFNIRVDGSSQFGENNRFAPFWSAGVRWNVKKEHFLSRLDWLNDFVVRGSYGVTGTQGFAPYQSQQVYSYNNLLRPYLASDGTGVELVALGNSKLKWQQTKTWNFGLELGFLDGRVTARAEYFRKNTTNSLTQVTLAPSVGFDSYPENMGVISNRGVELNFSFIPYRNREEQIYWIVNVNGSRNTDRIEKISEALRSMNENNLENLKDVPLPRYEEGESMNRIWVVKSLGIDPTTGDEVYVKRETGELTGIWNPADVVPCGNTEPKWQGNVNSSFTYKGFGFNMNFNYKFGGQTYNTTLVEKVENTDLRYNADKRVLELRWQKEGDVARYKRLSGTENGSNTEATSRFVMDENTFAMGSCAVSYRMDGTNAPFLRRMAISTLSMSFNMEDLFYLSSVKRERGLSYPFARQFSFSLNVTF